MARVLLVDTNFSSVPIYRALQEMGHEVHVVGANPDDCLAKISDCYWQQDYSDVAALRELIQKHRFDYVVPGCTDKSYDSCRIAGGGRFPGFDSAMVASSISHKARFRELAKQVGVPVPRLHRSSDSVAGSPVIVKPVDSFSGKGIAVLRDHDASTLDEAKKQAQRVSPTGQCLVEEFIEGQLYSYSAFLRRQQVVRSFLVQEDCTANPFVVDTSRVLPDEQHERIHAVLRRDVEAISVHLGLADGLLHTQFIDDGDRHWLIELTRRCPGDLYSQLIELSTGYPYAQHYATVFLGTTPTKTINGCLRPVMRHTISVPTEQAFDHVSFKKALRIERYVPLCLVGDRLQASPRSRVAVMFCSENSQERLASLYAETLRRDLYRVSSHGA